MSGWLRYFALNAQSRTGVNSQVLVAAVIAVIAAVVAAVFLLIAAFIWLSDRYDALVAGLVLGGIFVAIALIALIVCIVMRRRNMERARLELASGNVNLLDPRLMAIGLQVGQAIGWRRLASLAAVGIIAAGVAKEWLGRAEAKPGKDEPAKDAPAD